MRGQMKGREFARRRCHQAKLGQFPADSLPGSARQIRADAISRYRVMSPLPDRFGICARQPVHDMIQSKWEPAFLLDAVNARQELLCGQRSVERLLRLEAIVA